jgi:fatty acid desaturase
MFVPCWRLPAAHRLLIAAGHGPRMEVQPGYSTVLRLAASLQFDKQSTGRGGGTAHI